MCGISGILSSQGIDLNNIVSMNNLIRHRGPDDEGYVVFKNNETVCYFGKDTQDSAIQAALPWSPKSHINTEKSSAATLAFGHRRLSIVDISPSGHQPLSFANGRYWITYNGEIYNHIELRTELEALGYLFSSHSDTEVILAAYDCWGEDCLSNLNGMWAFALCDTKLQTIFFARDRFGIKPFYYWRSPEGALCFGSEIKQFTSYPGWKAYVNGQRAYDFLVWGLTDHTDETLFKDVYQLRPGCSSLLQLQSWQSQMTNGRLPVKQWYQLTPQHFEGNFLDAAEQFKIKFTDSVRLHLRSEVPTGSCLSGGLDSSSIVCVVNQLLREIDADGLQKTFSACAEIKQFDERKWIDTVVGSTGVEAHYTYPSFEKLFDESPSITWHQDEPYGSTSIYAQWCVFLLASQNKVKVMLDGQGADEQLAGYYAYFPVLFASLFVDKKWNTLWREMLQARSIHGYSIFRSIASMVNLLLRGKKLQGLKNSVKKVIGYTPTQPKWLNTQLLNARPEDPFARFGAFSNSIRSYSTAQLTTINLQMLLHWEDRNSMAHSIESRVPFLDYRLVEFVLGLPDEYKLADGMTKRVQRQGLSGILPDAIRDRTDKLGFVTPEEIWVKQLATKEFRAKLDHAIEVSHGILNPEAKKIFENMVAGKQKFNFDIWRMISFGEWVERFSVECQ